MNLRTYDSDFRYGRKIAGATSFADNKRWKKASYILNRTQIYLEYMWFFLRIQYILWSEAKQLIIHSNTIWTMENT